MLPSRLDRHRRRLFPSSTEENSVSGQIHQIIQKIIDGRAHGNPALAQATSTKLLMKGIDCSKWEASSADDPAMLAKVKQAAAEFGVSV
jgi:hypothetical protein